jgi:hypothetical protein
MDSEEDPEVRSESALDNIKRTIAEACKEQGLTQEQLLANLKREMQQAEERAFRGKKFHPTVQ